MISRDELYQLVWSEPMIKIGERLGVSGSYLARICTLLNVPRPERGYWARHTVGKAPPKVPLPMPRPGDPLYWSKEGERITTAKPKAPTHSKLVRKPRTPRNKVHGLIASAKPHFRNSRPVDEGAHLKPYKMLMVDVIASQASLDKALNLANDLFNTFESVGHRVVLASADANFGRERIEEREVATKSRNYWEENRLWSPYRPTIVYIGTVGFGLSIVEMSENVTLRYVNGKYIREGNYVPPRNRHHVDHSWTANRELPSGRMRIIAYSPYGRVSWSAQWQETKSASLRSQIRAIVEAIEAEAPKLVEKLEKPIAKPRSAISSGWRRKRYGDWKMTADRSKNQSPTARPNSDKSSSAGPMS